MRTSEEHEAACSGGPSRETRYPGWWGRPPLDASHTEPVGLTGTEPVGKRAYTSVAGFFPVVKYDNNLNGNIFNMFRANNYGHKSKI